MQKNKAEQHGKYDQEEFPFGGIQIYFWKKILLKHAQNQCFFTVQMCKKNKKLKKKLKNRVRISLLKQYINIKSISEIIYVWKNTQKLCTLPKQLTVHTHVYYTLEKCELRKGYFALPPDSSYFPGEISSCRLRGEISLRKFCPPRGCIQFPEGNFVLPPDLSNFRTEMMSCRRIDDFYPWAKSFLSCTVR